MPTLQSAKKQWMRQESIGDVDEKPEMLEAAEKTMMEAINGMDDEVRAAFQEARARVPTVVETESNPLWFLRMEDFNEDRAAMRLCKYWTQRKMAFRDRAFLPVLDLSGHGALNANDTAALRSQCSVLLPYDSEGRCVILADIRRVNKLESYQETTFRVMFYNAAMCAPNKLSQTQGLVVIRLVDSSNFSPDQLRRTLQKYDSAFPTRQYQSHICCIPRPEDRAMVKSILEPLIQGVLSEGWSGTTTFNTANTEAEMLEKLKKHGLSDCGLPACLGGSWRADDNLTVTKSKCPASATDPANVRKASTDVVATTTEHDPLRKRRKLDEEIGSAHVWLEHVSNHPSPLVAALQALRKANGSKGVSIRDLLRRGLGAIQPVPQQRTEAAAIVSRTKEEHDEALRKQRVKNRLLQKLVASKPSPFPSALTPAVISPSSSSSSLRTMLVSRVIRNLKSQASKSR